MRNLKNKKANRSFRNSRYSRRDAKNTRDRQRLAPLEGLPVEFVAVFICTGQMRYTFDAAGETALFKNVRTADGQFICDHVWVHIDDVENPDALAAGLGKEIAFRGKPYRYFSETNCRVLDAKYSIGDIVIE